jgi:hypothetical protein
VEYHPDDEPEPFSFLPDLNDLDVRSRMTHIAIAGVLADLFYLHLSVTAS